MFITMAAMNIGRPGCNTTSKILIKVELIKNGTYTILIFMFKGRLMYLMPWL